MSDDTKLFGTITADIKEVVVPGGDDSDLKDGEFEAILSMPTVDRDGEVIDSRAFEPLPDHLTIDIDHEMSVLSTVASGVPRYEGDILKFRGNWASTSVAQDVRALVMDGHIRKMSVAFMNAHREDNEDDGRVHITSAELLNAAIVPIPSNREASILAAKAAKAAAEQIATEQVTEPATADEDDKAAAPAPASVPPALAKANALRRAEAALLLTQ